MIIESNVLLQLEINQSLLIYMSKYLFFSVKHKLEGIRLEIYDKIG